MTRYQHVLRAVSATPWAIIPEQLEAIAEVLRTRIESGRLSADEITARLEAAAQSQGPRSGQKRGAVAVLPVYGTIMPRANLLSAFSGGATIDALRGAFREAMADESISALVMEFDSPGGQVDGVEELATEMRAARGRKPVVAVANTLMASAAYYLAAQADEIVASPSSLVGSIGVVQLHMDRSRQMDAEGVTPTLIAIPPAKVEGNPYQPLTGDAMGNITQVVEDYYGQFVAAVAKGRGVAPSAVRDGYGQGRVLTAKRALAAGMVDRIDTLDATIARLASGRVTAGRVGSTSAEMLAHRERVAEMFGVPVEMVGPDGLITHDEHGTIIPPVGMTEQQDAAQDDLADAEAAARARAQFELDADRWRFR